MFRAFSTFLIAAAFLGTPWAATANTYRFTMDTSGFASWSGAGGPYSLDFQFTDGDGLGPNNTVTVESNDFTGFTLFDGNPPFSGEQSASFTPGGDVSFLVSLTTNEDTLGTPDLFTVAILDQNGSEVPTLDPSGANTIMSIVESTDPGDPNALLLQAFDTSGVVSSADLTEVPEPNGLILTGAGALLVGILGSRWRKGRS